MPNLIEPKFEALIQQNEHGVAPGDILAKLYKNVVFRAQTLTVAQTLNVWQCTEPLLLNALPCAPRIVKHSWHPNVKFPTHVNHTHFTDHVVNSEWMR